jgi:hypothetical protein
VRQAGDVVEQRRIGPRLIVRCGAGAFSGIRS